jgi:hypothetical protein
VRVAIVILSIFNLRHEHLLSFCILWYWAFLANCVGRVATVILSIVNLHHEHLISLCILCIGRFWKTVLGVLQQSFWAFLTYTMSIFISLCILCIGRFGKLYWACCNSHLGVFNLHREHLHSLCILWYGAFWQTVLGVLQQSFWAFFLWPLYFGRFGICIWAFCNCIGRNHHSQGANISLVVVYCYIGRLPLFWGVIVYCWNWAFVYSCIWFVTVAFSNWGCAYNSY